MTSFITKNRSFSAIIITSSAIARKGIRMPHTTQAWPTDIAEAIAIQQGLRRKVLIENHFPNLDLIAGVDVGYDIVTDQSYAIAVLMHVDDLTPIATTRAQLPTPFPYVSGLLSFREIPVIINALKQLPQKPDLVMVDGQGIAHPRRLGIASHLGVLIDMPTIGVAKSRLTGQYAEPGPARGDTSPLMHKGERLGTVLRSKEGCKPLFISPGHRVDQDMALAITMRCLKKYRLPEPTRIADKFSKHGEREHVGMAS